MQTERWVVAPASPGDLGKIPEEQIVAGTRVDVADGGVLLVFRDRLTALKAAMRAGVTVRRGRVVQADGRRPAGAVELTDEQLLLLSPHNGIDRPGAPLRDGQHSSVPRRDPGARWGSAAAAG